ncbi:MAG: winged helix-turn-helix transcriptional regulator [Lachnospiraceae bacterium]|nr:winged helix-turn-helix transcriptional regulator [Lachnospiraceae bacterium]
MIIEKHSGNSFQIEFTYSAAVNLTGSLHVLSNPQHHSTTSDFLMQAYEVLSEDLRKEIRFFGDNYSEWSFISDIYMHIAADNHEKRLSFTESLDLADRMSDEDFAYIFLGLAAFHYDRELLRQWMRDPSVVTDETLGVQKQFLSVENVTAFLRDIPGMRARLRRVLTGYWDAWFAAEWPEIEQYFDNVIREEDVRLRHSDFIPYLKGFHPDLNVSETEIVFRKDPDFSIALSDVRRIVIDLSVFHEPHLNGNIVGSTVNITRNLNLHSVKLSAPVPHELLSAVSSLADETRLKMIKILWNSDSTTKDMSDVLALSPSTVSMHLKVMKEAGIVETTKIKKFVYYRLLKDRVRAMTDAFMNYVKY